MAAAAAVCGEQAEGPGVCPALLAPRLRPLRNRKGWPEGWGWDKEPEKAGQMLEISIFELRNTVTELEKRLNSVEDEDKLSIVHTFDQTPMGSLKEVLKQLDEEKKSLQNQLKDYEVRQEQEAKAYHKANDERCMYLSEILQSSATLKIVERQKNPDALTGKGEKQILRGRYSVPGNPKKVNPQKRSIKKTVGVNQLPQLKH